MTLSIWNFKLFDVIVPSLAYAEVHGAALEVDVGDADADAGR